MRRKHAVFLVLTPKKAYGSLLRDLNTSPAVNAIHNIFLKTAFPSTPQHKLRSKTTKENSAKLSQQMVEIIGLNYKEFFFFFFDGHS